ncbi:IucA/IucC family protein, partial [Bacillus sp. HC-TM]
MATSSLRTLYHPNSKYMLKFSFPVKVTNSMRINKLKE